MNSYVGGSSWGGLSTGYLYINLKPREQRKVTAEQVLAQILSLQPPDPAPVLLGALGVNTSEVRRRPDAVTPGN